VRLATMPLPNSYLFCKALQGGDELDESQLSQWDSDPPYQEPEPADTIEEVQFTKNLLDIMFGYCM
ncbi:hypothetical protein BS17DRAFT_707221, partial [Gyrodon lividus]